MHFAASGAEALDRLSEEIRPALVAVLSDINMPDRFHRRDRRAAEADARARRLGPT